MRVILKKNVTIDDIKLKNGDEGWVRGFRFGDREVCLIDVGEHKYIPVEKGCLEFPKREVKIAM